MISGRWVSTTTTSSQTLEDQGVATFDASWDHLGQRLATALGTQKE